jgi:hypothetical protein
MNSLDAKIEIYALAAKMGALAANPETSVIGDRRDVFICSALLEALKKPPVLPTIFLVYTESAPIGSRPKAAESVELNIVRIVPHQKFWCGLFLYVCAKQLKVLK